MEKIPTNPQEEARKRLLESYALPENASDEDLKFAAEGLRDPSGDEYKGLVKDENIKFENNPESYMGKVENIETKIEREEKEKSYLKEVAKKIKGSLRESYVLENGKSYKYPEFLDFLHLANGEIIAKIQGDENGGGASGNREYIEEELKRYKEVLDKKRKWWDRTISIDKEYARRWIEICEAILDNWPVLEPNG